MTTCFPPTNTSLDSLSPSFSPALKDTAFTTFTSTLEDMASSGEESDKENRDSSVVDDFSLDFLLETTRLMEGCGAGVDAVAADSGQLFDSGGGNDVLRDLVVPLMDGHCDGGLSDLAEEGSSDCDISFCDDNSTAAAAALLLPPQAFNQTAAVDPLASRAGQISPSFSQQQQPYTNIPNNYSPYSYHPTSFTFNFGEVCSSSPSSSSSYSINASPSSSSSSSTTDSPSSSPFTSLTSVSPYSYTQTSSASLSTSPSSSLSLDSWPEDWRMEDMTEDWSEEERQPLQVT